MAKINVLIVDDDENIISTVALTLERYGITVEAVEPDEVVSTIDDKWDLLLLDVYLGNRNGIDILESITAEHPDFPVVMISGLADMDEAVRAIQLGAFDFIEKPLKQERLLVSVQNASRFRKMKKRSGDPEIINESAEMKRVLEKARKVARTESTVLITGDSGTGKEVLARYIHAHSERRDETMVKLNCGAIPETLIESELFGHKKGSFTGAVSDYAGRLQTADKGTLFLDEVGELPLSSQVKLLRFLENREIQRIGDTRTIEVDTRIIGATNRNLNRCVEEGTFREDLYYRLNVLPIHLPSLSQRRDDIIPLAEYFLSHLSLSRGVFVPGITSEAARVLTSHTFGGNIRELKTVMERVLILSNGREIDGEEIRDALQESRPAHGSDLFSATLPLSDAKRKLELHYIRTQLSIHGGSIRNTAEALGILPNNLSRRIKQLEEPES